MKLSQEKLPKGAVEGYSVQNEFVVVKYEDGSYGGLDASGKQMPESVARNLFAKANRGGPLTMYKALSHPPNPFIGHEPLYHHSLYRDPGAPTSGKWSFSLDLINKERGMPRDNRKVDITYTKMGNEGPLVVFLHGVPTNRRQWYPVQMRVSHFCTTFSFDMFGMGDSSKLLDLDWERMSWAGDAIYIAAMIKSLYPGRKFYFVADDWGGGILAQFAAMYPEMLLGVIFVDPIAFDGYPVKEIESIGQASGLPYNPEALPWEDPFKSAMGAFPQTLWQIYKTMVHKPDDVYNQYSLRDIIFPYSDVDYERNTTGGRNVDGGVFTSMNGKLHFDAIRVLAQRAAILAPRLLLPKARDNPEGVDYDAYRAPVAVIWGSKDNMMPPNQQNRFLQVIRNAEVYVYPIDNAGHFVATDKPDEVAETLVRWLTTMERRQDRELADVFVGFNVGLWKGDESKMLRDLRALLL